MLSFSALSETPLSSAPTNQGDVNVTLPSIDITLAGSEESFTILVDYFGFLPAIAITLSADAVAPVVDAWLYYPVIDILFDPYPPRPATGIVRTLPTILINLELQNPKVSTGIALTLPTISFTVDDYEFSIGGIQVALPSITLDLNILSLKLTEGATVDFNVLKRNASGFALSEVPLSASGNIIETRAPVPEFMVRVFPIVPKMGIAVMLPAIAMTITDEAVEAISRPRAVSINAIAS